MELYGSSIFIMKKMKIKVKDLVKANEHK